MLGRRVHAGLEPARPGDPRPGGSSPSAAPPSTTAPRDEPVVAPPYIASVRWVTLASGRSLQVRPTAAGRATDAL